MKTLWNWHWSILPQRIATQDIWKSQMWGLSLSLWPLSNDTNRVSEVTGQTPTLAPPCLAMSPTPWGLCGPKKRCGYFTHTNTSTLHTIVSPWSFTLWPWSPLCECVCGNYWGFPMCHTDCISTGRSLHMSSPLTVTLLRCLHCHPPKSECQHCQSNSLLTSPQRYLRGYSNEVHVGIKGQKAVRLFHTRAVITICVWREKKRQWWQL